MSETFRFRVVSSSGREHVLRVALVHPDAALPRPEHTWVFGDALRALAGRAPAGELEVTLIEARNLADAGDPFGDRGSPFPADLASRSDTEIAAYFRDEAALPGADYRVRTADDVALAAGATADVA